ncbi:MAG: hypothetical protein JJU42_01165 [Rhodobacteraceae bacterium]|nr:hypothetical protein [Paracoccaceae bacterium]
MSETLTVRRDPAKTDSPDALPPDFHPAGASVLWVDAPIGPAMQMDRSGEAASFPLDGAGDRGRSQAPERQDGKACRGKQRRCGRCKQCSAQACRVRQHAHDGRTCNAAHSDTGKGRREARRPRPGNSRRLQNDRMAPVIITAAP